MPLPVHLFIHFSLAVLSGLVVGRYFHKVWLGVAVGILGGFLIDVDHIIEYLLVFGPHFNLGYFFSGRQFLISDKIRIIFHAWEWVAIVLFLAYLMRGKRLIKIILITLALGMLVHLVSDCVINRYPLKFYSIIYRHGQGYEAARLLSPAQWAENLEMKAKSSL